MNFGIDENMTKSSPPRRIALLIGNGKFKADSLQDLRGYKKDIDSLSNVLGNKNLGNFEVQTIVDKEFSQVRHSIALSLGETIKDDCILIYYSGTGFISESKLYLPTSNTDPRVAYATAIDANFLLEAISRSNAYQKILILDCCHSGAFFHKNTGIPDGLITITACDHDEFSKENKEGGYFTQSLVRGLVSNDADTDNTGRISVEEAFEYARKNLPNNDLSQSPKIWIWNATKKTYIIPSAHPIFISYSRKDSIFVKQLFTDVTQ